VTKHLAGKLTEIRIGVGEETPDAGAQVVVPGPAVRRVNEPVLWNSPSSTPLVWKSLPTRIVPADLGPEKMSGIVHHNGS
jgi:hypothetical protein